MREWTGIEIQKERERLEREAATILGLMLFEYSRLEMDLGLLLVWANDGQDLDSLTKKISVENLKNKLDALENAVQEKFANRTDATDAYAVWIRDAHQIRSARNQLFHGRWGVNATRQSVSCVVGLPTSPDQRAIEYSLAELRHTHESMRQLRLRLGALRDAWPV